MKRILLPTDFSENAWNAINYALSIFKEQPCDFFILNAFQVGDSGLMTMRGKANDTRYYNLMKLESQKKLDGVFDRAKFHSTNPGHTFKTIITADTLLSAIGGTCIEERIDCIIMGTKGASGVKEVFMGSNAYKIIKNIDFCPIVLVPDEWDANTKTEQILLATGYEHLFEGYEFRALLDFANLFKAKVVVGYVGEESDLTEQQKNAKKLTEKYLKDVGVEHIFIKEDGFIHDSIQNYLKENPQVGMLCMINYWHSFFEKLTNEPTIKKVSFSSKVPFLVTYVVE